MILKSQNTDNFVALLDFKLIFRSSFLIGLFFLLIGYILNDQLLNVLKTNTGWGYSQIQGLSTATLLTDKDTVSEPFQLVKPVKQCTFLSTSEIMLQENNSLSALVTTNIGFQEIPLYNDIVYLRDYGINTYEFTRLRKEPAENLALMFTAMQQDKLNPFVTSGYRTNEDQVKNYNLWTGLLGVVKGAKYAAKPGFSEHHLGSTVDILSVENGLSLLPSYDKTKVAKWLKKNAYKYGFVMSYPENSESTTGYTYEPWHFRFVGEEIAKEVIENNILLQDYLYASNGYCLKEQKQLQFLD